MMHKSNREESYKLSPQLKFYDSMKASWKTYSMFGHFANIRSEYCNTDVDGLRFNSFKSNFKSIFDQNNSSSDKSELKLGTKDVLEEEGMEIISISDSINRKGNNKNSRIKKNKNTRQNKFKKKKTTRFKNKETHKNKRFNSI